MFRYLIAVEFTSDRELSGEELEELAFHCEVQVSDARDREGDRLYAGIQVDRVEATDL